MNDRAADLAKYTRGSSGRVSFGTEATDDRVANAVLLTRTASGNAAGGRSFGDWRALRRSAEYPPVDFGGTFQKIIQDHYVVTARLPPLQNPITALARSANATATRCFSAKSQSAASHTAIHGSWAWPPNATPIGRATCLALRTRTSRRHFIQDDFEIAPWVSLSAAGAPTFYQYGTSSARVCRFDCGKGWTRPRIGGARVFRSHAVDRRNRSGRTFASLHPPTLGRGARTKCTLDVTRSLGPASFTTTCSPPASGIPRCPARGAL